MEKILEKIKTQKFKMIFALSVFLILAIIVIIRFAVYQKEGEKKMPYTISKIIVVSKANRYEKATENTEGEQPAEEDNSMWKFDLVQTNDFYISIEKKEENIKKNEKIKSVSIGNIQVEEGPVKGKLQAFMPNSLEGDRYKYSSDYAINESLTYRGAESSNFQNLQISSNGGIIGFSMANTEVGKYTSGEDEEVIYNGKLLSKLGLSDADVKSKVSFYIVIELDNGKKYSGKVTVDINCDGLVENGTAQQEITDFSSVIFKRV